MRGDLLSLDGYEKSVAWSRESSRTTLRPCAEKVPGTVDFLAGGSPGGFTRRPSDGSRNRSRRRVSRDVWGRIFGLVQDLEAVFFDYRIGKHFLGDTLQLRLRFIATPAIKIEDEELALTNVLHGLVAQAGKGVVDGLALGIEHGAFWHHPDVCFHAGSITLGTRVGRGALLGFGASGRESARAIDAPLGTPVGHLAKAYSEV